MSSSIVDTDALNKSIACKRCLLCGELQSDAYTVRMDDVLLPGVSLQWT